MAIYKVLFQPLEEYFFGEDNSFREGVKNAEYFIRSRIFPSQTTLFGILRYLNLEYTKEWGTYSKDELNINKNLVGEKSFNMENLTKKDKKEEKQNYGGIKRMSAVFLNEFNIKEKIDRIYVYLPKDAKKVENEKENKKIKYISFFDENSEKNWKKIKTLSGEKIIPEDYDPKKGLQSGFISLDAGIKDNELITDNKELNVIENEVIFQHIMKTGLRINKQYNMEIENEAVSSLFKKKYVHMKQYPEEKEYSFGIYVEIEGDERKLEQKLNRIVGMGLGGTPFKVSSKKISELEKETRLYNQENLVLKVDRIFQKHYKKENIVYCISANYVEDSKNIIDMCEFASIDTEINRPLNTIENISSNDGKWKKSTKLYRMLEAGSIMVTNNKEKFLKELDYKGLQQIGYNHYYIGGLK